MYARRQRRRVVGSHAACQHSGGYLSASRVHCAGRERRGGVGLTRSTELAEGGRPGSRPGVTFNLDLVSIGVSSPASSMELIGAPPGTPLHMYRTRPGATIKASNRLKRPCTQSKYSRLRQTHRYIHNSGVSARIIVALSDNTYKTIKW